jgi:DNA modification methylase
MTTKPQVFHGTGAVMDEIESGGASLVLTGPPYFPDSMEEAFRSGLTDLDQCEQLAFEMTRFAATLRPVFVECERILAADGALVVQTRDVRLNDRLVAVEAAHRSLVEATGLILYTRYLWRPHFVTHPRRAQLEVAAADAMPRAFDPEVFLVFKRPGAKSSGQPTPEDVALLQSDIVSTPKGHLPAPHKHQAPLPLLEAIIRSWSRPGQLVVDPFCGGGTTLHAAFRVGRPAIGYEIHHESVKRAMKNLEADT